ncbi:uncharacterized protein DS421_17g595040 [Arachis hypogaea]|nr:uncharacterized protein DS421_17g595040 [Arachis hypogaea]
MLNWKSRSLRPSYVLSLRRNSPWSDFVTALIDSATGRHLSYADFICRSETLAANLTSLFTYADSSNSSVAEDRTRNQMPIDASGRDRSTNMHSVLSPVENLTQWKAIKAKVPSSKHRRKENVSSIPSTTTEARSNFSPCFSMKSSVLRSKPLLP